MVHVVCYAFQTRDIAACLDVRLSAASLLPEQLCEILSALQLVYCHDIYSLLNVLWGLPISPGGKVVVIIDAVDNMMRVVTGTGVEGTLLCHLLAALTELARMNILVVLTRHSSAQLRPFAALWSDVTDCRILLRRSTSAQDVFDMNTVQWRVVD